MLRKIGGIVAGVVVFAAVLGAIEWLAHQLRPSTGTGTMLALVLLAYFVATLAGGIVAARVARERWAAWAIAILALVGVLYTLYQMPHPLWMQVGSVVAPLAAGFVAARILGGSRPRADGAA